jgi:CBS-domain-containing membrane protein
VQALAALRSERGIDQDLARDYVKSHGCTVRDVMTRDVVAVSDTTEFADIAMLLETKKIKRVPVFRDGKLVVIVALPTSGAGAGGEGGQT